MRTRSNYWSFLIFIHFSSLLICPEGKISSTQRDITQPTITTTPSALGPTQSPSSSAKWCVAAPSASQDGLDEALNYACENGADCSNIQSNGPCSSLDIKGRASYAFNSYYQKNPIPTSCNFNSNAVLTNIDPSTETCSYPSTSTSSGGVYSDVPIAPSPAKAPSGQSHFGRKCYFMLTFLMLSLFR